MPSHRILLDINVHFNRKLHRTEIYVGCRYQRTSTAHFTSKFCHVAGRRTTHNSHSTPSSHSLIVDVHHQEEDMARQDQQRYPCFMLAGLLATLFVGGIAAEANLRAERLQTTVREPRPAKIWEITFIYVCGPVRMPMHVHPLDRFLDVLELAFQ